MARDRLAAIRAQQQGGNTNYNSYPTQASGGGDSDRQPLYSQQSASYYEMRDVQDSGDMSHFYSEIDAIQNMVGNFNNNISEIARLHSQSSGNMDEEAAQHNAVKLGELVDETSKLSQQLKQRIKKLEAQPASGRDAQIRRQQTALVKSKFVEAIQNYQQVEQQHRAKQKQRFARQYKIVRPEASEHEIREAVDNTNTNQVFAQFGKPTAAYQETLSRHEEIKRIEQTLAELAQLFNDMSVMVEQQDEVINTIQTTAANVEKDVETGLEYTNKAVESARSARKKRWICFFIIVIVLIVVAIILAVVITRNISNTGNALGNKSNSATAPAPTASA